MSFIDNRRFFRVSFTVPLRGKARIACVNNEKVKMDKYFEISILDLSANGMKIRSLFDLPTEKNIVLENSFNLNNTTYVMDGVLLWKEDKNNQKTYGAKFVNITEKKERQLVFDLNKYLLNKAKLERENAGYRESPAAKMINAIPYPAVLVTAERKIIAVNSLGEKLGIMPGNKCYHAYWKENKVCSFCMLEEASKHKEIISYSAYIGNKSYQIYWLCLGKKIFLHYWRKK